MGVGEIGVGEMGIPLNYLGIFSFLMRKAFSIYVLSIFVFFLLSVLRCSMNLTHNCLVDQSILINWTSPCPILGVSGVLFHIFL